jgi:hypothetical protein
MNTSTVVGRPLGLANVGTTTSINATHLGVEYCRCEQGGAEFLPSETVSQTCLLLLLDSTAEGAVFRHRG